MYHDSMKKSFTERVYAYVRKIPSGEVRTYAEVARALQNPRAYRAVATALAKNYNPEIPCHRVIRSGGTLGGYNRGGVSVKQKLLRTERAILHP